MDILRIARRLAARSDALTKVESFFHSNGIYPPTLKEIGKNRYEGDLDDGWTLTVEEKSDGTLSIDLNGIPAKSLDQVLKAYKTKDKSYTQARIPDLEDRVTKNMYGNTPPGSLEGSGLIWEVFREDNLVSWTPFVDPKKVFDRVREIANDMQAQGKAISPNVEVAKAEKNYRKFLEFWDSAYKPNIDEDLLDMLPPGF